MNGRIKEVLNIMPENLRCLLGSAVRNISGNIEEIRLRINRPLIIGTAAGNFAVLSSGNVSPAIGGAYIVNETDIRRIFCTLCENSVYAHSEEIKQGYITIRGGHRAGFSGKAVVTGGRIENIRDINSINIRVASERIGTASEYAKDIIVNDCVVNTLVVSPPGCGKTTLLRDMARLISNSGIKVAVVDERGEIAAIYRGMPQNNIGMQTDVMEDAPKGRAIPMLLRSMSPQVIICDEIATEEDIAAIEKSFGAGVGVIASAHAGSFEEIKNRKIFKNVWGKGKFEKVIVLKRNNDSLSKMITGEVYEVDK